VPTDNDLLQTVDIPGVEIFCEGSWNGDKYTGSDLQAMIEAFGNVGFEPTVKAGHADGQESLDEKEYRKIFGAPALGYVHRIYRQGHKLLADLKQVPRRFANLIKTGTYKRISAEIYWNYKDEANGKTFPRVLKSVAFLGAEIPALTNLKAIEALFQKNENGALCVYEGNREYRVYNMENLMTTKKYKVEMRNGKWCVIGDDGSVLSEHASQEEAEAAAAANKVEGDKVMPKDEKKGMPNYEGEGDVHMTAKELQDQINALKAEMEKQYNEQLEQVKAAGEKEKSAMADRIAELEKSAEAARNDARSTKLNQRLESLQKGGKVSPVEAARIKAIYAALPDTAVHTYSDEKGQDVKESIVETIFKLFESRNSTLLRELAGQTPEAKTYSNAQAEVIAKAGELIAKEPNLTLVQAYAKIAKSEPELWREYQKDVKGAH
jgi:hypothetical protein